MGSVVKYEIEIIRCSFPDYIVMGHGIFARAKKNHKRVVALFKGDSRKRDMFNSHLYEVVALVVDNV